MSDVRRLPNLGAPATAAWSDGAAAAGDDEPEGETQCEETLHALATSLSARKRRGAEPPQAERVRGDSRVAGGPPPPAPPPSLGSGPRRSPGRQRKSGPPGAAGA